MTRFVSTGSADEAGNRAIILLRKDLVADPTSNSLPVGASLAIRVSRSSGVGESGTAFEVNLSTSDNSDLVASWCRDRGD